jgi:hypothetical protein
MTKPHKKLLAWQKSMDLVEEIYELARTFPREEIYGLTSQSPSSDFSALEYRGRSRRPIVSSVQKLSRCCNRVVK